MLLEKGKVSSELWVAVLIILPWFCSSMGIDLQQLLPLISLLVGVDLSTEMTAANDIRQTIQAANNQSDTPVLVGLAYVVGRPVLKIAFAYLNKHDNTPAST